MKKPTLLLSILFVTIGILQAGVQDFNVTPATLADWQLSGADRDQLQEQETLRLPAGAELSRSFTGGAVVLFTISKPDFGAESANWPVVQVGPAAVALTRKGVRGELVMLIDEAVSVLPVEIPLDASGKSMTPLELALGYDPVARVGVVAYAEQALSFKGSTNSQAVEVAVAAGAKNPWVQDSLEVLVLGSDAESDAARGFKNDDAAMRVAVLKLATEKLHQAGEVIGGGNSRGADSDKDKPKQVEAGSRLEIYTPASVRHSAGAIRDAIAHSRQK